MSQFVFVACQVGAERTILKEVSPPHGPWKLAFSRPGFLTLKYSVDENRLEDQGSPLPVSPYVRSSGFALGYVQGEKVEDLAAKILEKVETPTYDAIHLWKRDATVPGWRGFEPGTSESIAELIPAIKEAWQNRFPDAPLPPINHVSTMGQRVLDLIVVDDQQWWLGWHMVHDRPSSWPGGVLPVHRPETMISRAYLKMAEAVAWSRFAWQPGDEVVEIGSAPGGSCQRLLEMGLKVTGVDPAEMSPVLLENPNFKHLRGKANQLKRRLFLKFKWLTADANVAASYTLDAVGDIVAYPGVAIQGMLLTLKMSEWTQADQLAAHLSRIKSWGFPNVAVRQLAYNRREVCVAAWRNPLQAKGAGNRKKRRGRPGQRRPVRRRPKAHSPSSPASES